MANEVLNINKPQSSMESMEFDELGALEIVDPVLLSAVAAGTGTGKQTRKDFFCPNNFICP